MRPSEIRVFNDLKKAKRKGISFDDYGVGFRLGARIFDLRQMGHKIATTKETLSNGAVRARYVLLG